MAKGKNCSIRARAQVSPLVEVVISRTFLALTAAEKPRVFVRQQLFQVSYMKLFVTNIVKAAVCFASLFNLILVNLKCFCLPKMGQ